MKQKVSPSRANEGVISDTAVPFLGNGMVKMSKHEQYQGPETESATWNLDIITFIMYTMPFPQ